MPDEEVRPLLGNGARMEAIDDALVDLIITGPPYYPPELEEVLRAPRVSQGEIDHVRDSVVRHALSLRPVFVECARVLRPGGLLIVQTKDLRYGGALVGLASVHRGIAEGCGFALRTRLFWRRTFPPRRHGGVDVAVERARRIGGFVANDVEEFLVFSHALGPAPRGEVDYSEKELQSFLDPLWVLPATGGKRAHPHAGPTSVLRRLIRLFSGEGDLVVDPFAGSGTTLRVARSLGRRAIGWDIDPAWGRNLPHPSEPPLPIREAGDGSDR